MFDELPGVEVHGIQEAPLTFGEEQIKRQRALARPADARHHDELIARNGQRDIFQIMLARAVNGDDLGIRVSFRVH